MTPEQKEQLIDQATTVCKRMYDIIEFAALDKLAGVESENKGLLASILSDAIAKNVEAEQIEEIIDRNERYEQLENERVEKEKIRMLSKKHAK